MDLFRKHGIDYSQITEQIFIGTNACCLTHYELSLTQQGITSDISLEQEHLDGAQGAETFLWLPTLDHTPVSQEHLFLGANVLNFLIKQDKKIYVHCKNGHGRSPMLVAAYFILYQGMTVDEAINTIRAKRPTIHLDPDQYEALQKCSQTKIPQ
ncbi:MAG: dual specificity protein phosphatase family protein [Candidatus Magasanikbacteria bacterium]|nr:dual specificity protein phosphatase family protein [Candidatus Magasanikbacteria bacterium]